MGVDNFYSAIIPWFQDSDVRRPAQ
jgi:hypothetical protein